jgi:hypothetical protein
MTSGRLKKTQDQFIEECIALNGDMHNYSEVVYKGAHNKVTILCKEHDTRLVVTPAAYTSKPAKRCCKSVQICRGNRRMTLEEFKIQANEVHNNKYSYENSVLTLTNNKIEILCPIHGNFAQMANNHLRGRGCRQCATELNNPIRADIARKENEKCFIPKATVIHKGFYNYDKVKYFNGTTPITVTCPIHGDFEQQPVNHLRGNGCQDCAGGGFKVKESASMYILITDSSFAGFGITGRLKNRLATHRCNLRKQNIEVIDTYIFSGSGEDILEAEQYIKHNFANHRTIIEGFKTEAFTNDKLQDVLTYLRSNDKLLA